MILLLYSDLREHRLIGKDSLGPHNRWEVMQRRFPDSGNEWKEFLAAGDYAVSPFASVIQLNRPCAMPATFVRRAECNQIGKS